MKRVLRAPFRRRRREFRKSPVPKAVDVSTSFREPGDVSEVPLREVLRMRRALRAFRRLTVFLSPVFARRHAEVGPKGIGEMRRRAEARAFCDFSHRLVRIAQQELDERDSLARDLRPYRPVEVCVEALVEDVSADAERVGYLRRAEGPGASTGRADAFAWRRRRPRCARTRRAST